jgi:hypothetical protein
MNTQPVTEHTEASTDEYPAVTPTEVTTNDPEDGTEGIVPAPTLLMVNADDAAACTGDGCAVTVRKG